MNIAPIRGLAAGAAFVMALAATVCSADEVDELVGQLRPPARFKNYKPDFRVEKRIFTFEHVQGPIRREWMVVLDGTVDGRMLARAESAYLKVVLEDVREGEGTVRVNGTPVGLPDHDWITEVPVDPRLLGAENAIVFESSGDGYEVDVESIVLESPVR